ncbi:MAG: hypothetical protein ACYDBB_06345 [Armatimonadota bacterium]
MTGSEARRYRWAVGWFVAGQAGFLAMLLVCVVMDPRGLLANHGFSYYGDFVRTTLPYRLAFLVAGACTLLSSWYLPNDTPFRAIKFSFRMMVLLLFGIMVTTGHFTLTYNLIHVRIGVVLFLVQLVVGTWLALLVCRDRWNIALLVLAYSSSLFALVALQGYIPLLIEGQLLFQLAFGALMVRTLVRLRPR